MDAGRRLVRMRPRLALTGAAHDLLRATKAIGRSGVDPVDAQFEGAADGGNGNSIVLFAPPPAIAAAADGPRAEPDHGDGRALPGRAPGGRRVVAQPFRTPPVGEEDRMGQEEATIDARAGSPSLA